ncbi:enoyl-CoA hydratase/isomerase family protein [Amycolatopsis sp. Poz14]|uniref:enoyl-CoA hydratase/isomerase family protein n=1 Tax=Amycolatopsis sp. Poz14 TaxID=1447705 RepID=UPI001EE96DDA|nr:enoyl-CoA hydratase-related protein [Amycolatopsis sp. Poz14]MCG3754010.1 enoyl-CoA hydratase/isomerase family protein [Amycolatopsis sp. Poz14]
MDKFRIEQRGGALAGILNRPEVHNALDSDLRAALADFWDRVREDPEVRVAIVAGAPGSSFSSGRDMKETAKAYEAERPGADWELGGRTGYPADTPPGKPVIAAIDRYCMGAGLKIAAECDLRIAAATAVFASPQAKVGRATESPLYLRRAGIPSAVALDMVFTGLRLDAAAALHHGLVSRVVGPDRLMAEAWSMAETIEFFSPTVVAGLKTGLDAELGDLPASMASSLWKKVTAMYGDTPDAREGAKRFVSGR